MEDFSTKDFNTMVLLKYYGYKFSRVETEKGIKRVFVTNSTDLQSLLLDYDNGNLEVEPKDWMRTVDDIKEFVHR